jgi:hypothetical protein
MSPTPESSDRPSSRATAPTVRVVVRRTSVARLLATLYRQAPAATRADLLSQLLRPVGPLALVAIAAGAFGRLLPHVSAGRACRCRPTTPPGFSPQQVPTWCVMSNRRALNCCCSCRSWWPTRGCGWAAPPALLLMMALRHRSRRARERQR